MQLLRGAGVDHVLDVGAAAGLYGGALRKFGYAGAITSFEPHPAAFEELRRRAAGDAHWMTHPLAVGDSVSDQTLLVASQRDASSLLPFVPEASKLADGLTPAGQIQCRATRLDSFAATIDLTPTKTFLKVDVQGLEANVLRGAEGLLTELAGVEIELSFVQVYEGGSHWLELARILEGAGLICRAVVPGFHRRETGFTYQVDGIFLRQTA